MKTYLPPLVLALSVLGACSRGSDAPAPTQSTPTAQGLRIAGTETGGASGDALAASLLLSADRELHRRGRPWFSMRDGGLEGDLAFLAQSHIEAAALSAARGPRLEGSARIRRLAEEPGAPADANGNGSNLDETLAAELALLASTAGAGSVPAFRPFLFSWDRGSAELIANPGAAGRGAFGAYAIADTAPGQVDVEQIGHAMLSRALLASKLLRRTRGDLPGATSEEGLRGLMLMEQAIAMDETLIRALFFDGLGMSRVKDPATYDPNPLDAGDPDRKWKWLPGSVRVTDDVAVPGAPAVYVPGDRSSRLSTLATVLTAASELAWLTSDRTRLHSVRDLLLHDPFGSEEGPPGGPINVLTWDDDIAAIMQGRCAPCHTTTNPPLGYPWRGFLVDTYDNMMTTGLTQNLQQVNFRAVVPFDHANSFLWEVMISGFAPTAVGIMPPPPSPTVPQNEIDLVAQWIDEGALESVPLPPLRRAGSDLARVLFQNMRAMHQDLQVPGALHDRVDSADERVGFASARSTGEALGALVAYASAVPGDAEVLALLDAVAGYALSHLTDGTGAVHAMVDIPSGSPTGQPTDLHAHARMTAGLLAAGRLLGSSELIRRGRALGRALLGEYFVHATGLFRSDLRKVGVRYTPALLAAVLDALREVAVALPVPEFLPPVGIEPGVLPLQESRIPASAVHDTFLRTLQPVLAFAEWDGRGEILGDGIADTDGNGIPEPALAGGGTGRAPLIVGEILSGPAPSEEIIPEPLSWSRHILPLFRQTCTECHLDGAARGGYQMDSPALLRTPGDSGGVMPLVVPGDPEGSLLYRKLVDRAPIYGAQMPLDQPPLAEHGAAMVRQWILEGASAR